MKRKITDDSKQYFLLLVKRSILIGLVTNTVPETKQI